MRKTLGLCLLALLLAGSVNAGEIPNDNPASPPPTNAAQESTDTDQDPNLNGIMPNGVAESLTRSALDLLALLPSLL